MVRCQGCENISQKLQDEREEKEKEGAQQLDLCTGSHPHSITTSLDLTVTDHHGALIHPFVSDFTRLKGYSKCTKVSESARALVTSRGAAPK